jgi:hypothetical protein
MSTSDIPRSIGALPAVVSSGILASGTQRCAYVTDWYSVYVYVMAIDNLWALILRPDTTQ